MNAPRHPEVAREPDSEIVWGVSKAMQLVKKQVEQAARVKSKVLIEGPTGAGKEMIARAIHHASRRAGNRFVAINCGRISANLAEAQLFGHERGAYTGADRARKGAFRDADRGTLFLDEIGESCPEVQTCLLRALDRRQEVIPMGATEPIPVDVRVIAATNRDLMDRVTQDHFRIDTLYRLSVFRIEAPSLNDRREDIPGLIDHFLADLARQDDRELVGIADDALQQLCDHSFTGHVRELHNLLESALARTPPGELITAATVWAGQQDLADEVAADPPQSLIEARNAFAQREVKRVMELCGHDKQEAARILGISVRWLNELLKR